MPVFGTCTRIFGLKVKLPLLNGLLLSVFMRHLRVLERLFDTVDLPLDRMKAGELSLLVDTTHLAVHAGSLDGFNDYRPNIYVIVNPILAVVVMARSLDYESMPRMLGIVDRISIAMDSRLNKALVLSVLFGLDDNQVCDYLIFGTYPTFLAFKTLFAEISLVVDEAPIPAFNLERMFLLRVV